MNLKIIFKKLRLICIILKIANSGLFDYEYYRQRSNLLNVSKIKLIKHYINIGWKSGLDPSKEFQTLYYLQLYPDVRKAKICPLVHYVNYGAAEGRVYTNNTTTHNIVNYRSYGFVYTWLRLVFRLIFYKTINEANSKFKILVHIDLYNINAYKEIREYLLNIKPYNVVYWFTIRNNTNMTILKQLEENIKIDFKYYKIVLVNNDGFDVGPFYKVLKQIDLDSYQLVFHIHSKTGSGKHFRHIYGINFIGLIWFRSLISSILGVINIHLILKNFIKQNELKTTNILYGNNILYIKDDLIRENVVRFIAKYYSISIKNNYLFIAGNMFAVSSSLLDKFMKSGGNKLLFSESRKGEFTNAHAFERLICAFDKAEFHGINTYKYAFYILLSKIPSYIKNSSKVIDGKLTLTYKIKHIQSGLKNCFYIGLYCGEIVFVKECKHSSYAINEYNNLNYFYKKAPFLFPKPIAFISKNNKYYNVMEFIKGVTLTDLVACNLHNHFSDVIRLNLMKAFKIFKESNFLCFDINTDNIIFTENNLIKICDLQLFFSSTSNLLDTYDGEFSFSVLGKKGLIDSSNLSLDDSFSKLINLLK